MEDDGTPEKEMKKARTTRTLADRGDDHLKDKRRIPAKKIGFLPNNRGGVGICPRHVVEVAGDIRLNKTNPKRYHEVPVVELPSKGCEGPLREFLDKVHRVNKEKCDSDPLMPKYSPEIGYVAVGKTHFTHAQKLFGEGKKERSVYDVEGFRIDKEGIMCVIYSQDLLRDPDALQHIADEDNMNSLIEWGQDEFQFLCKFVELKKQPPFCDCRRDGNHLVNKLFQHLKQTGVVNGRFNDKDWENILKLAVAVPEDKYEIMQSCIGTRALGRVRVKASDFGEVAKFSNLGTDGSGGGFLMVCLMLHQYLKTIQDLPPPSAESLTDACRKSEIFAACFDKETVKQLLREDQWLAQLESCMLAIMTHYPWPDPTEEERPKQQNDQFACFGRYMISCAAMVMKCGQELKKEEKLKNDRSCDFTPTDRAKVKEKALKNNSLSELEADFRKDLLKRKVFRDETEMPKPIHVNAEEFGVNAEEFGDPEERAAEAARLAAEKKRLETTRKLVFDKLEIEEYGSYVLCKDSEAAEIKQELHSDEAGAAVTDVRDEGMAAPSQKDAKDKWKRVKLMRLEFRGRALEAQIQEFGGNDCPKQPKPCWVPVEDLARASLKEKGKTEDLHPALVELDDFEREERLCKYHWLRDCETHRMALASRVLWSLGEKVHRNWHRQVDMIQVSKIPDGKGPGKGNHAPGKGLLRLQLRAKQFFKKGELVFVPSGGELYLNTNDASVTIDKLEGAVHTDMPWTVPLRVIHKKGKRKNFNADDDGAEEEDPAESVFKLLTPLAQWKKQEDCKVSVPPFWGLLHSPSHQVPPNMELEEIAFQDEGAPWSNLGTLAARLAGNNKYSIVLPVARNTRAIEKGEVLVLTERE